MSEVVFATSWEVISQFSCSTYSYVFPSSQVTDTVFYTDLGDVFGFYCLIQVLSKKIITPNKNNRCQRIQSCRKFLSVSQFFCTPCDIFDIT